MSCQPIRKFIDLMLFGQLWALQHYKLQIKKYTKQWISFCYIYTALLCTNAAIHPLRCSIDFDCWTFILIVKKFKRPTQSSNEIPKAWEADSSKQQFSLHFEWKVGDRERDKRERVCIFEHCVLFKISTFLFTFHKTYRVIKIYLRSPTKTHHTFLLAERKSVNNKSTLAHNNNRNKYDFFTIDAMKF